MSKSRSRTPSKIPTQTPSKSPSQNPELFFQKEFFQPENPFYQSRLQSLLSYLIDIDIEDLPSLSSRKPFHFLLESLLESNQLFNQNTFIDKKNSKEVSYSNLSFLNETSKSSLLNGTISMGLLVSNGLLLSNVFAQLLRLLSEDLRLDKNQIHILYHFLMKTIELIIEKTEKEEFDEISSIVTQTYFLLESIEKYKILSLLLTKEEGFTPFKNIFFGSGRLQKIEPEIGNLLINIILELVQNDVIFEILMDEFLPGLIKGLARKQENKENYNTCVNLIKQSPLKLLKRLNKHFLHQYKGPNFHSKINKEVNNKNKKEINKKEDLSKLKELLQALKIVFKINEEIFLDIMTYIENDLLDESTTDDKKGILLVFFSKVSCQKNSKLSILQPRMFKELLQSLSKRQFSRFRYELLKSLLKYLYNHMDKRPISLQIELFSSKPYLNNMKLIENELYNLLANPNKDFQPKIFLLNQSLSNLSKSPTYLSQDFLESLVGLLFKEEFLFKESLYSFFSGLFLQNNSEAGIRPFPWLLKQILGFSYNSTKKSSVFFLQVFNEILFNPNNQQKTIENSNRNTIFFNPNKQEKTNESPLQENLFSNTEILSIEKMIPNEKTIALRKMLEIHEEIIRKVFSEGLFSMSDEKNYPNFLYKLLGLKWRIFYEKMRDSEGIVMKNSWERILKLREKISNNAKSLFIEDNTKEKRFFSEIKLIKYCGELGDIKKVSDALISLLEQDPNAKSFLLKLSTIGQRDYSLDYFLKKLKEDNLSLLLSVWFPQDFLWDYDYEDYIIKQLKECLFIEEEGYLKGFVICDLLNLVKKAFKISFSLNFIKEFISLMEDLEKGEIDGFKGVLIGLMLKILARSRIYKFAKGEYVETIKEIFCKMLSRNGRSVKQIKYLAVLLQQLDDVTTKKDFKFFAMDALERVQNVLQQQEVRESKDKSTKNSTIKRESPKLSVKNLSNDLKILRISIDESLAEQPSSFNTQVLKTLLLVKPIILNTPLPEPKGLLISHLALLKRDLILIIKTSFCYLNDIEKSNFLKDLLIFSLDETPQTDYLFLRVLSFMSLLELFSQKKLGLIPTLEQLVDLSMVCSTKDPEIRKLAFHLLIKFASKKEGNLSLAFLSLLFLFLGDSEKSLSFLAVRFLSKLSLTIEKRTDKKTKTLPIKIRIENSLQYSIVFLIGVLLKNPRFKGDEKGGLDYKMVYRFFEVFFAVFEEKNIGYFWCIISGLEKEKPIDECLREGYIVLLEIIKGILEKKGAKEEEFLKEDVNINPLNWLLIENNNDKQDLEKFKKEIGEFLEAFEKNDKLKSKSKGKIINKKGIGKKKPEKGKAKRGSEVGGGIKKIKASEK